jgi:hypothetical protein
VRLTSPSRRALGVFAVSAVGMSTALLGMGGVAQASTPSALTTSTPLTIPAGVCTVEWVLNGAAGSGAGSSEGGAGTHIVMHMSVAPGDTLTAAPVTLAGGAPGSGGGAGGNGIGLNIDGDLQVAAAGGGGAGTWNNGGAAESPGGAYDTYSGGGGGTDSAGGAGGSSAGAGTNGSAGAAQTGGAGGGVNSGGGGGGAFGGGGGASDGNDGTGGGGGSNLIPVSSDAEVTDASGPASITYEYQDCTADQVPLAPSDLTAQGGDGTLTVDFTPSWNDAGPDTWQYQYGSGAWTDFEPTYNYDGDSELVLHGLTNGTPYSVHVRGVSSEGVPGPAGTVTGTPFKPIGAPTNVAYTVSGSVVTITWNAPATTGTYGLAGYQAQLGYNYGQSGGLAFQCETGVTVRTCAAPAPPGPNYTVFVNAVDSEGNAGDSSNQLEVAKIAAPASVPASDGALSVPGGGAGSGATGEVVKGHEVNLHGTGYQPNSLISVILYSTPQVLTAVMTDASGSFDVTVTVPAGLASGHHTLVAAGVDPSGHTRYLTLPITVTAGKAELAYTGASVVGPGVAGLVALTVGTGLLFLSRRRRTS